MYLVRKFYSPDEGTKPAEENQQSATKPEDTDAVALAKALKDLKENSVSREEYDRVVGEKSKLVSEIINGSGSAGNGQPAPSEQPADIDALKDKLYGPKCGELSNLDYWKYTLELRDAVIKKGDPDPFLPIGSKISPDANDREKAENVANVVQQCIEECDGNSELFTALLQSKINPDSNEMTMRLKKLGIKFK